MSPHVDLVASLFEEIANTRVSLSWPSVRYADDPVGFARDILGIDSLWEGQIRILDSVKRPKSSTIVRAGTKVGKSYSIAILALWAYCTIPRANVVMTASNKEQLSTVLWAEISYLFRRSGVCAACRKVEATTGVDAERPCPHSSIIDGHLSPDVAKGLSSEDRVLRGVTGNRIDAYQGISGGSRLFLIVDEATGVRDDFIAAFRGNLTGARFLAIANPNRTDGFFWECHLPEQDGIHTLLHLSTREAASFGIDGLASYEDIERARREYGEDSPIFLSKYMGEFPTGSSKKLIALNLIAEAVSRWATTEAVGLLHIGCDPAKYGDDDTALAARRGQKVLEVRTHHGLDEHGVADFVMDFLRSHVLPGEVPIVKVDSTGQIGADVVAALRPYDVRGGTGEVRLFGIHAASTPPKRETFKLWRDQAWMGMKIWLAEGGAIPANPRLEAELHAPDMSYDERQRIAIESKTTIKKRLKRSPDLADACQLAIWDDPAYQERVVPVYSPEPPTAKKSGIYNPYEASRNTSRGSIYGRR